MCRIGPRAQFLQFYSRLREQRYVEIVPVSQKLFHGGYELYKARMDKGWSLTDCMSFVVMVEQQLSEAMTHDQHFEQAGFKALLR